MRHGRKGDCDGQALVATLPEDTKLAPRWGS